MANVLVIGGTGFLSSTLVAACLSAGHHVSIVTRGRSHQAPPDGVEALVANRSDPDALRTALDGRTFDIVLDSILYRPEDAHSAVDLFRGGRTGRYVFISTDFVYGGEPRTFPLDEDAPRHASGNYGRNKALCEDVFFDAWERERFPAVILRPPHILGVGGLLGTGSLEGRDPWLLWKLRNGWPIPLLDGGALLIQPVHKNDIARACLAVCQTDKTLGRAYNLAGPDCVTSRRYYEIVADVAGAPPPLCEAARRRLFGRLSRARAVRAKPMLRLERIARDAGFAPSVRLRDALAEVVAALDAAGPARRPAAVRTAILAAAWYFGPARA
jgi:nucleoside-diphosphate-sugar epimerase